MSEARKLPAVYATLLENLRRKDKDLNAVPDDELLRRLRRTQPDIARELDDLAGVPRSRLLDALYEKDESLRAVSRGELARRVLREHPDAVQRDSALAVEAALDQPPLELKADRETGSLAPAGSRFGGLSPTDQRRLGPETRLPETPFRLEQLQGRRSLKPAESEFEGEAGVPGRFEGEQEQRQRAAAEYAAATAPMSREEYAANLIRATQSPPLRIAASALGGALMFVEAPFRVVSEIGRLTHVGAQKLGIPSNVPPEQFLSTRLADVMERGRQILETTTRDPEAGWVNNFLTRVLPQGMISMLGFASGARLMTMRAGFRPGPAVASLGAIQTGSEAVKEAAAGGATDRERAVNLLAGGAAGLLEALPIARWILPRAKGTWVRNIKEGIEEGFFQELPQQIIQNAAAEATYDPGRPLMRDTMDSALAGLVLGTGGSRVADIAHEMYLRTPRGRGQMFAWLLNQHLPEFDALARVLPPDLQATLARPPAIETVTGETPAAAAERAIAEAGGVTTPLSARELLQSAGAEAGRPAPAGPESTRGAAPEAAPSAAPEAAPSTAPEAGAVPGSQSGPETTLPAPVSGVEPAGGQEVLGVYTPDDVGQAIQDWTVDDYALMAAHGMHPRDLIEVAEAGELPRWLPLDNPAALTYYLEGRRARSRGANLDEVLLRVPRPMIPVTVAGYGTAAEPSGAPASASARPAAGAETAATLLTPIGANMFRANYRYDESDLPAGMVVGGEYRVAGQQVHVPEAVPHDERGRVPVVYAWVRAADVVPSHRPDGSVNPEYGLVNTRDYANAHEQEKLLDAQRGWDPTLHVVFAPVSSVGPPIVMLRGGKAHVVGGNSRTITIQNLPPVAFAHHSETENQLAGMFGLPPAPLDGQAYILVRVMPKVDRAFSDPALARALSDLFNESPGRQQSTIEKALADAPKISLDLLARYASLTLGATDMEAAATGILSELIKAGLVDRNTRSSLLERPAEAMFYVQALIMAAAYGERATAIINLVMGTDVALLSWLGRALMKPALMLRQVDAEGAVVADLISEFLTRVLRGTDSGSLSQIFTTAASQIEPGNWKRSAIILGLAQMFVNELVFVRTGKGGKARRVDYENSRDGFETVIDHLIKVVHGVIQSRQHGVDLITGAPASLTDSMIEWLRRRVPLLIAELERVANLPTGRDMGLFEESEGITPDAVAVQNPEGWGGALPPIPQRVLLDRFLAEHPDNAAARRRWLDLKARESAEQARLAAAVKSGRSADEVIAEIVAERGTRDRQEMIGLHRRLRRLLKQRGQGLTAAEHQELRYLETVLGQLFMDFLDAEARTESARALEARRREQEEHERHLRRLSGTRSEPPVQGTLFEMPDRYEGRREQYAQLTARALYGQELGTLSEGRRTMIYALVDDMLHLGAPAEALYESHKPQELFPPGTGRSFGPGGKAVSRTAPRPTTPVVAGGARGQQSVLDLSGISLQRRREQSSAVANRSIIVRHPDILPSVSPLTHPEHYRWLLQHVPGVERLTAVQLEGVLRILANWFGGSGHFLLADGTGVGKTAQLIAVSAVAAARTGKPVLLLAPDDRVIEDNYARDSEMLGVRLWRYHGAPIQPEQRILTATYTEVSRGVVNPLDFETVVFDEAHALRNDDLMSTRADIGIRTIQKATRVLLATATPLDEPWQIWYLTKVIGRNPEAALRELGISVEYADVNGETRRVYRLDDDADVSQDAVEAWLDRHFLGAMRSGNMVQREFSLGMLDVDAVSAALTADQLKYVSDTYAKALQHAQQVLRLPAGRAKGYALLRARSALERAKVNEVIKQAVDEIRKGRQVIIYLSRVSDPLSAAPLPAEDSLASARLISDLLEDQLGVNTVGRLFGGLSGQAGLTYAAEVVQRFREGSLRLVVSTPQSGGTGLSLDDVHGDAPRTVFLVTAPFSAQEVVQIAGRVVRVTTKSRAKLVLVTSSSRIDSWNLDLVTRKLSTLGAVIGRSVRSILTPNVTDKPETPTGRIISDEQIMLETVYEAAPDRADNFWPIDWEYWNDLARRGSLMTRLYRWAWGGGRLRPFSLIGRRITGLKDLLGLMQLLRNPSFEVSRFVVVDPQGVIRHVLSTTAGMPGTTNIYANDSDIIQLAKVIVGIPGARVYHIHNHPSGSVEPSPADQQVWVDIFKRPLLADTLGFSPEMKAAWSIVSAAFAGAIVTDHLKGSLIEIRAQPGDKFDVSVTKVGLSPRDLPPEYTEFLQEAYRRSEEEIRASAAPESVKKAQLSLLANQRESAIRSQGIDDPFLAPAPQLAMHIKLNTESNIVEMVRRLALPVHPELGNHIAILATDAGLLLRGIFWVSPAEFLNRELLEQRLIEASVLFGGHLFMAAVPTDTNPPIVEMTARQYAEDRENALFSEVVTMNRGRLRANGPGWEVTRYSYNEKMTRAMNIRSLHLQDSAAAYSHRPPGGTPVTVALGGMGQVSPLNMPLVLQLYRALSGGQMPRIRRSLGKGGGGAILGRFRPRTGEIELLADIFKDPELARRVFAHEIGHWVDWLPDKEIARGNLWGRLLSLRRYLKDTYGSETVTNSEFRQELLALSTWWRPWDPSLAPPSFRKYRNSAVELYADFISVLFNAPMEARARAPKFYEQFWKHLNSKPDLERTLLDIQQELAASGLDEADKRVVESILKGYENAEERMVAFARERAELARSMRGWFDELVQELIDPFIPAERLERSKRGPQRETRIQIKQVRRPATIQEATEMLAMRETVNYRMLKRIHDRIVQPLRENGVTLHEFGLYLQLGRIARGDRASLGNPEGLQPADAERLLQAQEVRLGPIRHQVMQQAADLFHQIVFEVSRRALASGLISPRIWRERILPNRRHYATFWVVHHVSDRITPMIRPQVGTFSSVANPFIATVLKLMTMNSTIAWNNAARAHVDFLRVYFPADIADTRSASTNTPGRAVLTWLEDGRVRRAEMDAYLVRAFEHPNTEHTLRVVRLLRNAFRYLIYPLIITYNLGYLYLVAPWKDLRRTAGNLPLSFPTLRLLRYYPQAVVDAWKHYYGDDRPIIREMLDNLALGPPWDIFARQGEPGPGAPATESEFYQQLLKRAGVVSDTELRGWFQAIRKFFTPIGKVLDAIEAGGLAINDAPKVAAYRVLIAHGFPRHQAARFARRQAGLPHVFRRGIKVSTWSALFPFWNVFVQGLRGDAEVALNPRSAPAYWWRWASTDGLAAALAGAASAGLLGWLLKELFDGIPEYDKENYTCIPIGIYRRDKGEVEPPRKLPLIGLGDLNMTFGWKVVYIRIPRHETHRLLSGLVYHVMRRMGPDKDVPGGLPVRVLSFGADQLPGINPVLTVARAWGEYATGRTPLEPRTGRPILDYYAQRAGGVDSLAPMFHFTLSQMGVENFIKYDPEAKTTFEMAAAAVPGLNRVIKASDYGYRERQMRMNARLREEELKAENMQRYPTTVRRVLAEYNRLTSITPAARTPNQVLRLNRIIYWRNNVFRPLDEQVLNFERQGMRDQAARLREQSARLAEMLLREIETVK